MSVIPNKSKRFAIGISRGDLILAFSLCLFVFALYVHTLVPSMLDGDPGQFQYVSAVSGVPYPPGFPLYLLLGHLWSLLPLGTLAFRMNLLSAVLGTLTITALFVGLRQQGLQRLAAWGGALTMALVPTFWQYATMAAEYTLHTFLTVLLLIALDRWATSRQTAWLGAAMLILGLGLTNHPTFLLFVPATALFVVIVGGRAFLRNLRLVAQSLALGALPAVLYLYFPLRGHQLLAEPLILPNWPVAIAQGIVSPFFRDSPEGWLRYWTASTFVKTVAQSWKWNTLAGDLAKTVLQSMSLPMIALSLIGAAAMVKRRPKLAVWLGVSLVMFALIPLQYAYAAIGDITDLAPYLAKFFLPGFVVLVVFAAWGIDTVSQSASAFLVRFRFRPTVAWILGLVLVGVLLSLSWQDLVTRHSDSWVQRSGAIEAKWADVEKYPPEDGAALVAHWGDLTPLWYLQNSEGWRRDIVAFYPPQDQQINAWLAKGKPLYLAGSLLGWAPGVVEDKSLTPWGNLVRVSKMQLAPPSPLAHPTSLTFQDDHPTIRLLGFDVSREGEKETVDVAAYWEILQNIPLDNYIVYFSLGVPNVETKSQGDVLAVNWYPTGKLVAGQRALGIYHYPIPKGTPAGTYELDLFVYSIHSARDLDIAETKETIAALGKIKVQ